MVSLAAGSAFNLAVVRAGQPILILLGDNPMTIEGGTTFADPGARAADANGVDLTPRIVVTGNVDGYRAGTYTLTYHVATDDGRSATAVRTVNVVDTTPPTVGAITAPVEPVPVNTPVQTSATFVEACGLGTAAWQWGDGSQSAGIIDATTIGGSHTYTAAGVYTVTLTLTDAEGNSSEPAVFQYVVVYNPDGGFVTGGGWITSSPGAYRPDPALTGKASFGFNSQYKKNATVPTGQTQFTFHVAGMSFHSESYEWLVISGAKARYKGFGTINGSGDYEFLLIAIDGQVNGGHGVDKFRMKIWDQANGRQLVYDNELDVSEDADPSTALSGGSIVIHKEK